MTESTEWTPFLSSPYAGEEFDYLCQRIAARVSERGLGSIRISIRTDGRVEIETMRENGWPQATLHADTVRESVFLGPAAAIQRALK